LPEPLKQKIISYCEADSFKSFGAFNVQRIEKIDGFKFHLDDNSWVMIRPSGTEPVLRIYSESENHAKVIDILNAAKSTVLAI
jgi:phosphomannomutase